MKFIRVIKADVLEDYKRQQDEKRNQKEQDKREKSYLKKALEDERYARTYYINHKGENVPEEVIKKALSSNDWDGNEVVKFAIDNDKEITKDMEDFIVRNMCEYNYYKDYKISEDLLLESAKYIKDAEDALDFALYLKKRKINIPDNIKKLMMKSYNYSEHINDFEDLKSDYMKKLDRADSSTCYDYLANNGTKNAPENVIRKGLSIKNPSWLTNLLFNKLIEDKYHDLLIKNIAKEIDSRYYDDVCYRLIKKYGLNTPDVIVDRIIKIPELCDALMEEVAEEGRNIQIPEKIINKLISSNSIKNLRMIVENISPLPQSLVDQYCQEPRKALKLYKLIKESYYDKAPKQLIDTIASDGRLSYKAYQDLGNNIDTKILNSARKFAEEQMNRGK